MKELIEYIGKALVSEPEQVVVHESDDGIIELQVAPDDRGKVIGKRGRTVHAMRMLVQAASPEDKSYSLEIID